MSLFSVSRALCPLLTPACLGKREEQREKRKGEGGKRKKEK